MVKKVLFSALVSASLCVPNAGANVLNVPGEYPTLQAAVNAASAGDTVVLAPGTYDGGATFSDLHFPSIRSSNPNDPAIVASTIIQGSITIPSYGYGGEGETIQISGLTIYDGGISVEWPASDTKVVISKNTLTYCLSAIHVGYYNQAEIWILDNTIKDSLVGIRSYPVEFSADVHAFRNEISGNYVGMDGFFTRVIGNSIQYSLNGGAVFDGLGEFSRNYVGDNLGAGVSVLSDSPNSVHNNYIVNNDDGLVLGMHTAADSNTIVANGGVGVVSSGSGLDRVRNSIIYANGLPVLVPPEGALDITYTCSNVSLAGEGNLTGDPMFAGPAARDYHLTADSPCINRGTPDYDWSISTVDYDDDLRVSGNRIDIGADETPYATPALKGDMNDDGTIDGLDIQLFIAALLSQ